MSEEQTNSPRSGLLQFIRSRLFISLASICLTAILILGIRFAKYSPVKIHYHANFAVYLNGKKEEFKDDLYYSEISMCTASTELTPTERAHMHDHINNVVHVEDHAVTWGQFFTNLGWYLGPAFIVDRSGTIYSENTNNKLHIILNDKDYTDLGGISNTTIEDQDRLLVSFGDINQTELKKQYDLVPSTAKDYDTKADPKTCSGSSGPTIHDKLTHLF